MEPTIYKPCAYKLPGIYNGTGGIYNGRGVYNGGENVLTPYYYYTLYKNFDFSTKIDYPIVGDPTQYETANNYSYSSDNLIYDGEEYNALNLKNSSNAITNKSIPLKLNSYIEFICKINMVSYSAPLFIWTNEGFGFYVDLNRGNKIGILCPQSESNYTIKNGAILNSVSYGVRWFLTPLVNDSVFKFRIDYLNDKIICGVNGVEYVVFNKTSSVDTGLKIDPRMNNNVSITDIKCFLA
jgi:hypothetical protein